MQVLIAVRPISLSLRRGGSAVSTHPDTGSALLFSKLAKRHGGTILHGGNIDLLTKDLGDALRRQKKIIQDPDLGVLETAYEALPVIAEVKVLTVAVSKKMGLDTTGKSTIGVLEDIVLKTEARNSVAAQEIKSTLAWTRDFFAQPEIQEILAADLIRIEAPTSWKDLKGLGNSALQGGQRLMQEFSRLHDFLKKAKEAPEKKISPKNDGPKN